MKICGEKLRIILRRNKYMKKEKTIFPKCSKCFDKGYSTELKGNEFCMADFIGEKTYIHRGGGIRIHLCDCGRGKDLKMFFNVKKQFKD